MTKRRYRYSLQPLLLAAALPLGLLAEGATPAFAAIVDLTGANGGTPGGAAPLAAANAGPNSDPLNTATAAGGAGGAGGNGVTVIRCFFGRCYVPPPPGGCDGWGGRGRDGHGDDFNFIHNNRRDGDFLWRRRRRWWIA